MKLKNYYVCFKAETILYDTICVQRISSVKKMLQGSRQTWKDVYKKGWRCIKVDIEFTPVKK